MTLQDDDAAPFYCRLLDAQLDRIGYSFSTRCGLLFVAHDATRVPNPAKARRFFEHVDPLVMKIVTITNERVRTVWERRMPKTTPLRVNGKQKKGARRNGKTQKAA